MYASARTESYHVPLKKKSLYPFPDFLKKEGKGWKIFYILYEYLVFTSLYVTTVGVYKTKTREIVRTGIND